MTGGAYAMGELSIDERLMLPRKVMWSVPDAQGLGYELRLECGHQVWMAVQPQTIEYCASCLEQLIKQVRAIQAHQEPRG
jgi:hypothetical protein